MLSLEGLIQNFYNDWSLFVYKYWLMSVSILFVSSYRTIKMQMLGST